jgi:hypothetical protein
MRPELSLARALMARCGLTFKPTSGKTMAGGR